MIAICNAILVVGFIVVLIVVLILILVRVSVLSSASRFGSCLLVVLSIFTCTLSLFLL